MENQHIKKPQKPKNIHSDHRKRMRDRLRAAPQLLTDHEVLEMLLYHIIPRGNTNSMAHDLLNKGKTFKGVLDLTGVQIKSIHGLGVKTAEFLEVMKEFYARLERQRLDKRHYKKITPDNISEKLHKIFIGIYGERTLMITLDEECRFLRTHLVADGNLDAAVLPLRRIVSEALADDASYVILAHNHPNNVLAPSESDIEATRVICEALSVVNVPVIEHYIVTEFSELGIIERRGGFPV